MLFSSLILYNKNKNRGKLETEEEEEEKVKEEDDEGKKCKRLNLQLFFDINFKSVCMKFLLFFI